jgi:plastocyanin
MKEAILFAVVLLATGCGKSSPPAKSAELPKAVQYFHVDPATAGVIHGTVLYRGPKPTRKLIDMESDAGCQKAHAGNPAYDEPVMVGKHGGLENAFVYIKSGLEGKKFEPSTQPVVLDQHGCMFVPRVSGVQAGGSLDLRNSDSVSHNIHLMPENNYEWNQQQSPNAPDVRHKLVRPEIMIPIKCNVHSWMHAYIGVVDNPYFAVTGADGSFEWKNVPPGDYTIGVWHEKLGEQTAQAHVAPSGSAAVDFTYR